MSPWANRPFNQKYKGLPLSVIELHIRPYKESDEDSVIKLWLACGLTVPWNDPQKDINRKLSVQRELFIVGLLNDQVIATAMGGYDGHRGWVNYLGVDPKFQRMGYARQIMQDLQNQLLDMGCPKINLQIRESNEAAIEFYKQIGFKQDAVLSMGHRLIPDKSKSGN